MIIIEATDGLLPHCPCGGTSALERDKLLVRVICTVCGDSSFWKRKVSEAAKDWKLFVGEFNEGKA